MHPLNIASKQASRQVAFTKTMMIITTSGPLVEGLIQGIYGDHVSIQFDVKRAFYHNLKASLPAQLHACMQVCLQRKKECVRMLWANVYCEFNDAFYFCIIEYCCTYTETHTHTQKIKLNSHKMHVCAIF